MASHSTSYSTRAPITPLQNLIRLTSRHKFSSGISMHLQILGILFQKFSKYSFNYIVFTIESDFLQFIYLLVHIVQTGRKFFTYLLKLHHLFRIKGRIFILFIVIIQLYSFFNFQSRKRQNSYSFKYNKNKRIKYSYIKLTL